MSKELLWSDDTFGALKHEHRYFNHIDSKQNIIPSTRTIIWRFTSTLVVTLHLRPLRSPDRLGVEPWFIRVASRYAAAQTRSKR